MNIHEHQAKDLLKEFEIPVPKGFVIYNVEEIFKKIKSLNTNQFVLKAQIHAGGRGKAGGIKIVKNKNELIHEATKMFGKTLITHQTGPQGKKIQRIYIEEVLSVKKEFYLACLIDRESAKIAFISSTEGGVDIEDITKDIKLSSNENFALNEKQKLQAKKIINSIFNLFITKDASLIEINPLTITASDDLCCLDAKINFDDNALFKHPEIIKLRDLTEENSIEIQANKHNLSYIKLDGSIGCMVNGAGLAMATNDIIKLYGKEPANFLDVGGGASKEKVSAAFKIILSD